MALKEGCLTGGRWDAQSQNEVIDMKENNHHGVSRRSFLKTAGSTSALGITSSVVAAATAVSAPANQEAATTKPQLADLRAEFDEYGFVVLRELIRREDAERAEARVKELMARRPDADKVDQHIPGFMNQIEPKDDEIFLPLVTQP